MFNKDICGILTYIYSDEPVQLPNKIRISKCWFVTSVISLTVIEYTSECKGSDQTEHMHRLV